MFPKGFFYVYPFICAGLYVISCWAYPESYSYDTASIMKSALSFIAAPAIFCLVEAAIMKHSSLDFLLKLLRVKHKVKHVRHTVSGKLEPFHVGDFYIIPYYKQGKLYHAVMETCKQLPHMQFIEKSKISLLSGPQAVQLSLENFVELPNPKNKGEYIVYGPYGKKTFVASVSNFESQSTSEPEGFDN